MNRKRRPFSWLLDITGSLFQSKHSFGRSFRSTKAYADDRQKAKHNQRKKGLRKRKRS